MIRRIFYLKRRCRLFFVLIGALLGSSVFVASAEEPLPEQTFELEVVSIFDPVPDDSPIKGAIDFARRGLPVYCNRGPLEDVVYPDFESDSPLYGEWDLRNSLFSNESDIKIAMAVDESQGTGTGYDLFYIDVDGNGVLTDNPPLAIEATTEEQARNLLPSYRVDDDDWLLFEPVRLSNIDFESFDGLTYHLFAVQGESTSTVIEDDDTPRDPKRYFTVFIRDPEIRMGEISLGGHEILVTVDMLSAADYSQTGALYTLHPLDDASSDLDFSWWGAEFSTASHYIDGHYYKWKTSPDGKRLTVYPYEGGFGVVRVELDELRLQLSQEKTVSMSGDLFGPIHAADMISLSQGESDDDQGMRQASVPVGDYTVNYASFTLGDIHIRISNTYHEDGRPQKMPEPIFGIPIREDEPFFLDFADTPEVLFALPAQEIVLKLGDVLEVKPVLVDQELGVMYRGMNDYSQQTEHTFDISGEIQSYMEPKSMDPTVVITDSSGEVLGSGIAEYG